MLVTPKRKLAGRLAVMKTALHFFGEFLVEGTGGSSVFKNFQASSTPDPSKIDLKHKPAKWPLQLGMESEKDPTSDISEATNDNAHLRQKQLKTLKRHRRWNIDKVRNISTAELILYLNLLTYLTSFHSLSLDKSCALDSLSAQVHCNRGLLQQFSCPCLFQFCITEGCQRDWNFNSCYQE